MELTFTNGEKTITVSVIPGSFKYSDRPVDAGGGVYPAVRTNQSVSGSCAVLVDESFTFQDALSLISPVGHGNIVISEPASCKAALVDVDISGDGVQVASLSWVGNSSLDD